jgi:hypothetical protein
VLKKRKVEAHRDFILDPVSPKEYKDTNAELNGSRTNRVFEFFKINPLNSSDLPNIERQPRRKLSHLLPPKRTLRRRRPRRVLPRRKSAGGALLLRPLPLPKGGPGRNAAGSRRTLPHHPRGPGSSTLKPASSRK